MRCIIILLVAGMNAGDVTVTLVKFIVRMILIIIVIIVGV